MIHCLGVASINIPTMSWEANFTLESTSGSNSTRYVLKDKNVDAIVSCHSVYLKPIDV